MKYESSILKRLVETYGVVGNPRYISEVIKEFIVRGKERFPELFTYQSDWLAHIDEFGLNPTYTVSYTGQSIYAPNTLERPVKSAILSGSTKYRDIDTGEVLDTFEDGRNLELVSVKMPVLTTTGKNLFDFDDLELGSLSKGEPVSSTKHRRNKSFISVDSSQNFSFSMPNYIKSEGSRYVGVHYYNVNKQYIGTLWLGDNLAKYENRPFLEATKFVKITIEQPAGPTDVFDVQIEQGPTATSYEPYKSNILTVNEDVTLRSNGDICDELNLLTGQLTQRIGEDGVVLSQEVVKTVDLTILDQNGQNVKQLMSFNGGTHFNTGSLEGSLLPTLTVDVVTDLEEILMVCSSEGITM